MPELKQTLGYEYLQSTKFDRQTWRGEFTLPQDAGLDSAQTLSFNYRARDELDNVCSDIRADNSFQIYQGDLPPLQAPRELSGSLKPGGKVKLSWDSVADCSGYRVYRKSPQEKRISYIMLRA